MTVDVYAFKCQILFYGDVKCTFCYNLNMLQLKLFYMAIVDVLTVVTPFCDFECDLNVCHLSKLGT